MEPMNATHAVRSRGSRRLPALAAVLLVVACACRAASAPPPPLAGRDAATPSDLSAAAGPAPSRIAPAATPLEVVRSAYREITGNLFREVAPAELLAPAWQAVAAEARRQGFASDVGAYAERGADDIEAFTRELQAFLAGPGATLDAARIGQAAVRGMATAVGDSHTRFLTPEQADNQRRAADGDMSYSGIGIRINQSGSALTITEVFANSPAELAGLRAGDRIVRVNGRDIGGLEITEFSAQVRGPEGTEVQLTIERAGEAPRDLVLHRARISIPLVTAQMLDDDIGYIRISSFPRRTATQDPAREFDASLARLLAQGARALVLDLRGNPGGDPFTSVAVASNFVPEGPIFISVNRDGRRTIYPAVDRPTVFRGPLAVLVDRGTASGAEVVASALQEYGVGHLIGARTCGCLSVGQPLQLPDASGLVVTVAQALTGRLERSLEGVGLEPDQFVTTRPDGRSDAQRDRAVAYLRGQLP
jgi:carboxyl-terminal processing protease